MMHFVDSIRDGDLLAALKDEGVIAPDVIVRIDASLGHPESGTLSDFLLAGAAFIPERAWLSWLIRRHGCHRFGRVSWTDAAVAWSCGGVPEELNLPVRRCPDGSVLVAVMRPDRFGETASRMGNSRLLRAAATLAEMQDLRSAWQRHPERDSVTPLPFLENRVGEMHHGAVGMPERSG